jgi:hypothetical protein
VAVRKHHSHRMVFVGAVWVGTVKIRHCHRNWVAAVFAMEEGWMAVRLEQDYRPFPPDWREDWMRL